MGTTKKKSRTRGTYMYEPKYIGGRYAVMDVFMGFYVMVGKSTTIPPGNPLHSGTTDQPEKYLLGDEKDGYGYVYSNKLLPTWTAKIMEVCDPVAFDNYKEHGKTEEIVNQILDEYLRVFKRLGWLRIQKEHELYCRITRNGVHYKAMGLSTSVYKMLKVLGGKGGHRNDK